MQMWMLRHARWRKPVRKSPARMATWSLPIRGGLCYVLRLRRADQYRLLAIQRREQPLEIRDLRRIVDRDVAALRMERLVVLVIALGVVEILRRLHLGDDLARIRLGLRELIDVRLRRVLLRIARIPEHRAILRAVIRALVIELGRIGGHGEEGAQEIRVRHLRRIEGDAYGLGVAGAARAHLFVARILQRTASVT